MERFEYPDTIVKQPKHLRAALLCLSVIAVLIGVVYSPTATFTLTVVLFVLCSLPWVINRSAERDTFNVIYAVCFMYFLYFGISTIYLQIQITDLSSEMSQRISQNVDHGLMMVSMGMLSILAGYYMGLSRKIGRKLFTFIDKPSYNLTLLKPHTIVAVLILFCFTVAFRLYMIQKGWFLKSGAVAYYASVPPYIHSVGYVVEVAALYVFMLFFAFAVRKQPGAFLLFWICVFPLELFFSVAGGSKFQIIVYLVVILAIYHYLAGPLRWRWIIVATLFVFVVVFPFMGAYRLLATSSSALDTLFKPQDIVAVALKTSWSDLVDSVVNRFYGIGLLARVLDYVPSVIEYQYGKTLIYPVLAGFVPSVVWPDKREIFNQPANLFGEQIWGYNRDIGGVAMTQVGELYLNFGVAGVMVGLFAAGMLYRIIYTGLVNRKNLMPLILYVYLFMWLINIEFYLNYMAVSIVRGAVLIFMFHSITTVINAGEAPRAELPMARRMSRS